jgi:DNA-binding response OmpR family regulator
MNRILIVEDDAGMASFLDRGLASRGYATTVVGDGARAVAIASDSDFDLVILDLGLPDLDGLTVLRELRRRGDRLPILILTARDDSADKVEGLDAGADDYVTKPFGLEELLARVRARLRDTGSPETAVLEVGGLTLDVRTRRAIIYDYDPGSNVVRVYVAYLRRKLGGDVIETVRGMGYRVRSQGQEPRKLR